MFANDGLVNRVLSTVGIPTVDWFQNAWAARWVIVIALIWRWTGYNMVFYLAGLQNIDYPFTRPPASTVRPPSSSLST